MEYRFEDILEIRNGKNQKAVENPEGRYPIYGSGGVIGYADDYICEADTIIIGRKGSINNPIYVSEPFWNVDTAFGLSVKKDLVLPRYLYYFCKRFDFEKLNKTVTIPSLTKSDLLKIKINLPVKDEQQAIIDKLMKIESIMEFRKTELDYLDVLIKARFVEMFGDPVSNSRGLPKATLPELGELGRGVSKHRPRNDPKLLGGIYPLIQTGDVATADLYITTYDSTYSELGLKQSKMWGKGTLCITIAANIAKTAILDFDACFPDSVVGFQANDKTNNSFNAFMPHEISKKRYIITTFQHRTVSYSIRAFTCFRNCLHCILYICIIFTLERILSLVEGYFEKMIWSDCSPTKMQLFFSSFQRF